MSRMAAFILAGGVGKRLSLLTATRAKPAVTFAGRYRIVDFTLTNCVRSEIPLVHVLTQYISRSLKRHLGIGKPWGLDRLKGGLHILHPRLGFEGADWYKGTADAMYQNIPVLRELSEDYVLVLSGDHVYNMDYRDFLEFHIEAGRPVSLSVVNVPASLCCEFGIATIDSSCRVVSFREKPKTTKSRLASMGIYIFQREFLISILERMKPQFEDLDFGKHIIPGLVKQGMISAYRYNGYWLDIGTLKSYYNASLSLLSDRPKLMLDRDEEKILTVPDDAPPMVIGVSARIKRSMICNGCSIKGSVINSILSPGVSVAEGARVENSIILHDCRIDRNAHIRNAIVDETSVIGSGVKIGSGDPGVPNILQPGYLDFGVTLIGRNTKIPSGLTIGTNCLISGNRKSGRVPAVDIEDGGVRISEGTRV